MAPYLPEPEPLPPTEDSNNNTGSTTDVEAKPISKPEVGKKTSMKTKERVFPEVVLDVVLEVAPPETHNSIQEFFQTAFSPSNHTRLWFS